MGLLFNLATDRKTQAESIRRLAAMVEAEAINVESFRVHYEWDGTKIEFTMLIPQRPRTFGEK